MSDPENVLSVTLRPGLYSGEYSVVCRHLASALGQRIHLKQGANEQNLAIIARQDSARVEFPIDPTSFNPGSLAVHELAVRGQSLRLLTSQTPRLASKPGHCRIEADLLTPIHWMMTLREEHCDLHRDRFGLVEGRRSIREKLGALSEPFFENVVELVRLLLDIPKPAIYPNGATWAVALSSDIDVLEEDHLGGVLSFLDSHEVDRPTFMICPAISSEKTIRDPQYDITHEAAREFLAPLLNENVEIGLHGSYLAHDRLELLTAQKKRLEEWCNRSVRGHRAHFYRFAHPRSWMRQLQAGLSYDSSLGYPDLPGLRSGCTSPTVFFDPACQPTGFTIFPTILLDQHFFWPDSWDDDRFVAYASKLLERAASLRCALNLDWHTYTWTAGYPGWWERLSWILREARRRGAYIGGIGAVVDAHLREWRNLETLTKTQKGLAPAAHGPRYYEQPALWGNAPDRYQIQVRADLLEILPADVQSVLDLGCGDGYIANAFAPSLQVVGMDISAEALSYLRRPGVVGSGDSIPFENGSFDLVMANDVLEHLATPQRERVLAEMCRVARRYVLYTSPHDEQLDAHRAKCADCGEVYHVHWHQHAFRGEELPRALSSGFELLEVRYSGDVTLPPADPLVPLKHQLGMYHQWSDGVCPKCGSNRQISYSADSFLNRILAARRCELWYFDLRALSRSSNRSEIMALYGKSPKASRQSRDLPGDRADLRDVDFTNALQLVDEFTPGSFWATFRLSGNLSQSDDGVSRPGDSAASGAIGAVEVRLPVIPRAHDRLILETSPGHAGTVAIFSLDGVRLQQTPLAVLDVPAIPVRHELVVSNPWAPDTYGAGMMLIPSEGVIIRRLSYRPADKTEAAVDFVRLNVGHNVLRAPDQGVSVSWGLSVYKPGRFPRPHLALQARPSPLFSDLPGDAAD
ncbi:MAG TPA: methyltransferase domain-containing protein, partial [Phycisphaerae bacterium]|nr:methyltransferase domain-containing protein [Phycisphaerae bacterium]